MSNRKVKLKDGTVVTCTTEAAADNLRAKIEKTPVKKDGKPAVKREASPTS
jgi:hypothetical protein